MRSAVLQLLSFRVTSIARSRDQRKGAVLVKQYIRDLRGTAARPVFEPAPIKPTHNLGLAHVADDWLRLDRFLLIGTSKGTYYVKAAAHTLDNVEVVRACVMEDGPRIVNRIVEISEAGRAPKQDPG